MQDRLAILRNPLFDYTLTGLLLFRLFLIPFLPFEFQTLLFSIVGTLIYINLVLVVKKGRDTLIVIVFVLFVLKWFLFFTGHPLLGKVSSILSVLLFLGIVIIFITSLIKTTQIDVKTILHAVNGYLILGVIAGVGIEILMMMDSGAISFPVHSILPGKEINQLGEYQYFGLSTLTTLGYGDFVPISPAARSFATFITMSGQMYLAIIIALLVGKYSSQGVKTIQ